MAAAQSLAKCQNFCTSNVWPDDVGLNRLFTLIIREPGDQIKGGVVPWQPFRRQPAAVDRLSDDTKLVRDVSAEWQLPLDHLLEVAVRQSELRLVQVSPDRKEFVLCPAPQDLDRSYKVRFPCVGDDGVFKRR